MESAAKCVLRIVIVAAILVLAGRATVRAGQAGSVGAEVESAADSQAPQLTDVVNVQRYNRSIHIMVMLLAGFGFLMVFAKKYGLSAVTATYLLVNFSRNQEM